MCSEQTEEGAPRSGRAPPVQGDWVCALCWRRSYYAKMRVKGPLRYRGPQPVCVHCESLDVVEEPEDES